MNKSPDDNLEILLRAVTDVAAGREPEALADSDPAVLKAIDTLRVLFTRLNREGGGEEGQHLRESTRFLESVVENIPDMIFIKDAKELRFVRFNRAGEELLGHSRESLIGRNDYDFFPPDEADFFTAKDRQVLEGRTLVDIAEEPIHTAIKGLRYLHTKKIPIYDDHGDPSFLLGISEDITERKLAEEELSRRALALSRANEALREARDDLRGSEARLRLLLAHFPGAVWTTDASHRLISVAGASAPTLDLDGEDVMGRSVMECLGSRPGEPSLEEMYSKARDGEAGTCEWERGGRIFEVRVEPLDPSLPEGVIAVALDVTERRRLEAERMQARLQQSQKLESLGLLAGGIAHDFNNLLVGMLGNASLAMMKLGEDSPARESVHHIEMAAERAADLTRQMLAYSGKGRFVVEPMDLSRIVEEMAHLLRVSLSRRASLKLSFEPQIPAVEADVAQIRQLVMNLITNASDAVGDRPGLITLSTSSVEADREYLSAAYLDEDLPAGRYVCLEVNDDGVGMDLETQRRMFDPFFSTKPTGHGLGLAAALGIVRGHKGAIRVYSELGKGTSVKVLFPAAGASFVPVERPPPSPLPEGHTATILVVDDEEAVRGMAAAALRHAGYKVLLAADGPEALEIFHVRSNEIDLVLLDMTMPHMTGEETFRALRRMKPEVRVLLSSGYNEIDATSRFVGKGLAGFLQKPYRARDLIEQVGRLVGG